MAFISGPGRLLICGAPCQHSGVQHSCRLPHSKVECSMSCNVCLHLLACCPASDWQ